MSASVFIKVQNISVNRIRDILEYNNIENKKLNLIDNFIKRLPKCYDTIINGTLQKKLLIWLMKL